MSISVNIAVLLFLEKARANDCSYGTSEKNKCKYTYISKDICCTCTLFLELDIIYSSLVTEKDLVLLSFPQLATREFPTYVTSNTPSV